MGLNNKIAGQPNSFLALVLLTASVLSVTSCASTKDITLQKALATSLSDSEKQTIEDTISNWFGGTRITIASNAFGETSSITIERRAKVDSRGLPIEGRHDNPLYSFTLLSDGKQCLLRNDQTEALAELANVKCHVNEKV
ncbi:hypothetical protein BM527_08480 [Alteromonas sp. Mex14]|nr:hypothetical protein BM527_08480 [Alteromonas sp. Mex14]